MAACSVRRKYDDAPFVEEYIVPQLLLQWVTERNEVQGIAYFSVRLEPRTDTSTLQTNFVFPVRKSAPAGVCEALREWVTLTEPAYWPLLEPGNTIDNPRRGTPQTHDHPINLMRGHSLSYGVTPFGLREIELLKRDAGPM
jgi:hypothetical protein